MIQADATALRVEHDALLDRLSARVSTVHFAHAAIGTFLGLILSGTAGKLFWDFGAVHPEWALATGGVGVVGLGYSIARMVLGRRALTSELEHFGRLGALRRELKLDESALET